MHKSRRMKPATRALTVVTASLGVFGANAARAEITIKPYGFIRAEYTGASDAVGSFGNRNSIAPTEAYPVSGDVNTGYRDRFSVAQSRLGIDMKNAERTSGRVEVDFVDFTKGAPTTAALPRLRIAKIEYKISDTLHVMAGQDWDLFSPLNPYTFNFVGNFFEAGNSGFIRQQVMIENKTDSFDITAGVGGAGTNNNGTDGAVEKTVAPAFELRLTQILNPKMKWGVAGLVENRTYLNGVSATSESRNRMIHGLNIFGDFDMGPAFAIRVEAYQGTNLADQNTMLTLSQGSFSNSVNEWGGYVSAKTQPSENCTLFGTFGIAKVTDPDQLVSFNSGTTATFRGIQENVKAALGTSYRLSGDTQLYFEASRFVTTYKTDGSPIVAQSTTGELGLLWTL